MSNPFGLFLEWFASRVRRFPKFSTWFAAVFLSVVWTIAWLAVFFLSTWQFDLSTQPRDLVTIFWLSVAAEAVIRWAENTNLIARLSKPYLDVDKAHGDNFDFHWKKAIVLVGAAILLMFIIALGYEQLVPVGEIKSFDGQNGQVGWEIFKAMVVSWWSSLTDANVFTLLLLGTLFRAIIYKRSHQSIEVYLNQRAADD
jgi:hypothetical protein